VDRQSLYSGTSLGLAVPTPSDLAGGTIRWAFHSFI